jgi:hypothetical protein
MPAFFVVARRLSPQLSPGISGASFLPASLRPLLQDEADATKQRIRHALQAADHRPDSPPLDEPAPAPRLPQAPCPSHDRIELARTPHGHHTAECAELDRANALGDGGSISHSLPVSGLLGAYRADCSATIRMVAVLPHPGMLPSGSSIASPECSRRHVGLSIDYAGSSAFRGVTQIGFPVRWRACFPVPTWRCPKPRRVAEGIGRSGATRSHGQSDVAFAFCHLLGFHLLPRLKRIHAQRLYRPVGGEPDAYPGLRPVLSRPIDWDLIRRQYNEMVKFATHRELFDVRAIEPAIRSLGIWAPAGFAF